MLVKDPSAQTLYAITIAEVWERFVYYGTHAIIVLYLTQFFLLSDDLSFEIYGIYLMLAFSLTLVGGLIADKALGAYRTAILGLLALCIGNLILFLPSLMSFYTGLALSLLGTGLCKSNLAVLIGNLYQNNEQKRSRAYALFYTGANVGATLAPIVYGVFIIYFGWRYTFLINAVVILISLLLILAKSSPEKLEDNSLFYKVLLLLLVVVYPMITIVFIWPFLFKMVLLLSAVLISSYFLLLIAMKKIVINQRVIALLLLNLFILFFFIASLQIGSSINLFLQEHVNRQLFNIEIPAIMLTVFYPLSVLIMVWPITKIWEYLKKHSLEPSIVSKIAIGLLFSIAAFLCFAFVTFIVAESSHTIHPIFWVALAGFFLGIGEICIIPSMYVCINKYAPYNWRSTMISTLFLFIAVAGYFSGLIAQWDISYVGFEMTQHWNMYMLLHWNKLMLIIMLLAVSVITLILMRSTINNALKT